MARLQASDAHAARPGDLRGHMGTGAVLELSMKSALLIIAALTAGACGTGFLSSDLARPPEVGAPRYPSKQLPTHRIASTNASGPSVQSQSPPPGSPSAVSTGTTISPDHVLPDTQTLDLDSWMSREAWAHLEHMRGKALLVLLTIIVAAFAARELFEVMRVVVLPTLEELVHSVRDLVIRIRNRP